MRRALLALTITAATGWTLAPASASTAPCGTATTVQIGYDTYYIDERPSQDVVPVSGYVIYKESNDIAGLQRGGSWPWPVSETHYDLCSDGQTPDTLIL